MYIILLLVLVLGIIIAFSYYYYYLIKRIYLIFKKNISDKINKLFMFLGIIFSIVSLNMFSVIGIFLIHFILISLLIDLMFLIFKKIIKNRKIINIYKLTIIPLIITIILFIYGFFNIRDIVETKYTLYTDKEIGEDIRILLLTDSHYGDILTKSSLDNLKNRLDDVNADIVILGGDIVDERTSKEEMEYIFSVFGDIKNKDGIYYVYGNHDAQQYNINSKYTYEELNKVISDNDIYILKDNYTTVKDNVVIAGRNDYSMGRASIDSYLDVFLDSYLIMVDHQPIEYSENIDFGIDLILSGHTHAGQIFPIESFINLLHTADLSYGYERFNNMDAIVSSGVAGWGYPIRTSRHSEYVVIDVKEK